MSIKYVARKHIDGGWCVGYDRPSRVDFFVASVGHASENVAQAEADRQNTIIAANQRRLDAEAVAAGDRRVIAEFYQED